MATKRNLEQNNPATAKTAVPATRRRLRRSIPAPAAKLLKRYNSEVPLVVQFPFDFRHKLTPTRMGNH